MNTDQKTNFSLHINVTDILLTPLSCSSLVSEVLKGVLYQKSQIPYTYDCMRTLVTRKRQKTEGEKVDIRAANYFHLVSGVFDKLELAMLELKNEFSHWKSGIREVLIVFGTTPVTANEVFSIKFSSLVEGHNERNHILQLNQYQKKILRKLFLSQDWLDRIEGSSTCTNIFLYILKTRVNSDSLAEQSVFVPTNPVNFSPKMKRTNIIFKSSNVLDTNCCDNVEIFDDVNEKSCSVNDVCDTEQAETDVDWYKFKDLVKGFKDCFVNKRSLSELW
ncbi:unnamed protein product [Phyllotreta striolata]|uniref:MAD2L1-binding protein n=1 Tax=Phyllotreta striolata TaxID=444603 RepID=A0A9N9XRP0_PHYSR|nr:unnamed protein product [Phyllotreta striolata]